VRKDYRAPDVLLYLFNGEISKLVIAQKPETLHFGLDQDNQTPPGFYKVLRNNQGNEQPATLTLSSLPWLQQQERILDIVNLVNAIETLSGTTTFTSAQFAFQMIESTTQVAFEVVLQE
jgi:hypothetical protein